MRYTYWRRVPGRYYVKGYKEALSKSREPDPTETEVLAVWKADESLGVGSLDASHLFVEELRMLLRALREIVPEEVTDKDLAEIMPAVNQGALTLQKIMRKRKRINPNRRTI